MPPTLCPERLRKLIGRPTKSRVLRRARDARAKANPASFRKHKQGKGAANLRRGSPKQITINLTDYHFTTQRISLCLEEIDPPDLIDESANARLVTAKSLLGWHVSEKGVDSTATCG